MFFAKYFAGSVKIFPLTYELFRCMFFIPKHKGFGDYLLGIDFFFKKVFLDFVNLQCCISSGVQQSESVLHTHTHTHIHISTLFYIHFPIQRIE